MRSNRVCVTDREARSTTISRTWSRRRPRISAGRLARSSGGRGVATTSAVAFGSVARSSTGGFLEAGEYRGGLDPVARGGEVARDDLKECLRDVARAEQLGRVVIGKGG